MTPAPDSSREYVEWLAARFANKAAGLCSEDPTRYMAGLTVADALDVAALLRALVDERDGERAVVDSCKKFLDQADEDVAAAYARGFREGAEQMREAAAGRMHRIAENERATKPYAQNDDHVMRIEDTAFALDQHGRAIRALPLPEPQA